MTIAEKRLLSMFHYLDQVSHNRLVSMKLQIDQEILMSNAVSSNITREYEPLCYQFIIMLPFKII